MRKIICLTPVILLITSCFGPVQPPPINKYTLDAVPQISPTVHKNQATLLVFSPNTKPVYNTINMIYSEQPHQINAYVLNQWAKTPSEMLQPLIVETLLKSNHFKAVVTSPYVGRYTYGLNTQLFELQQDYTGSSPVLHLRVQADIIRESTGNVIASTLITLNEPILKKSPYAGVVAANQAVKQMLAQLNTFVVKHT